MSKETSRRETYSAPMMELVFILTLIVISWRMRRAARRPQRIEIHHYFHIHGGGDGERDEEPLLLDTPLGDNVLPLRRNRVSGPRI